ncbi:MAG: hypothetical protein R2723_05090 [Microbacterium sp.]
MQSSPEGPVAFFLRTSVMDDDALDRALIATSRLAQRGSAEATETLRVVRARRGVTPGTCATRRRSTWCRSRATACTYNNAFTAAAAAGPVPRGVGLDALVALVERATR